MTKPKHPTIAMSPVPKESRQIHSTGFDPATGKLAIQFHGKNGPGSVYHYDNFTAEKYADFLKAKSIGAHFGQHIKSNVKDHPFTKVA